MFCVGVKEGQDLVKKDKHLIGGKSDPYVVLKIGESKVSFKVPSYTYMQIVLKIGEKFQLMITVNIGS